ncbi:hypothetical protein HII12_004684 [Brettanomyces bruxellensis]|uniref:Nucleoporin Nup54 alpha-helical domain-containing protein n=1 Tax=Dekkera bruxellensis TaxID=5007 RepID=A0A8H6ER11_DEKBR|nr:hypothetical protein HII12_004684 [Brettanomyces bruxellensis]
MFGANKGFGGANNNSSFSFGSSNNNNSSNNTGGGFSFGNNSSNSNNTNGSGFKLGGNSTGGGFNFGANKPASTTTNTGTGGFNFGANANKTATGTGNSGFSFGSNNTNNTSKPATGGGFSFGSSNTNNLNKPAASGGFSFGNKPTGTSLFGNNNNSNMNSNTSIGSNGLKPSTGTGFSFGNNNNTMNKLNTGGGFSFGNNANGNQNTSTGGLFGQNKPAFSLNSTFTNGQQQQPFQSQLFQSSGGQQDQQRNGYTPTIAEQLEKIKNSWDASSQQCLMKTHFYNKVPAEFNGYQRPLDESPEEWENAMKERPKGYNSIPVKVKGFQDLLKRSNLQIEYVKQSRVILNGINDNLVKLSDKHDLDSAGILLKCKNRQKQLDLKLLRIAINLSILKYKGYPLTNDEEKLVLKLRKLLDKIDDPVGLNRANELWARLSNLKRRLHNIDQNTEQSIEPRLMSNLQTQNSQASTDIATRKNVSAISKLAKVLSKEQQGLQYLYELIEGDKEALAKHAKILE